jgi:hypothetical protein
VLRWHFFPAKAANDIGNRLFEFFFQRADGLGVYRILPVNWMISQLTTLPRNASGPNGLTKGWAN